jgi:hypothetical protein
MRSRKCAVEDAQQDVEAEITCRGSRRTPIERDALSSLGGGHNSYERVGVYHGVSDVAQRQLQAYPSLSFGNTTPPPTLTGRQSLGPELLRVPVPLTPLFTQVPRIIILGSSYAAACIDPPLRAARMV